MSKPSSSLVKKESGERTILAAPKSVDVVGDRRYQDESQFTSFAQEYNFYNAMREDKDPDTKLVISQKLISLRGIPLKHAIRPTEYETDERTGGFLLNSEGKRIPKPERSYFVFVLTAPCEVKTLDKTWKIAEPGEFVWVDAKAKLAILEKFLPRWATNQDGSINLMRPPVAVFECIIHPLRLDTYTHNGEGRKAWRFEVKGRELARAPENMSLLPPATPERDPEEEKAQAEIPF